MSVKDIALMKNYNNLASATMLEAAREYCERGTTPAQKRAIIKDLNGQWMDFLTNGMSKNVAEELQKNEQAIRIRLRKAEELN